MSRLFDDLKEGLSEALAHAEGKQTGARSRVVTVARGDVKAARLKAGLTQEEFAAVLGAGVATLRKWEQGQRRPSGAAARLIQIIALKPGIAAEVLAMEGRGGA